MLLSVAVFITASVLSKTFGTPQQSVFFRYQQFSFGIFKRDWGKRLSAEKVKSFMLKDHEFDCPFKCLNEPKCFSFNIATFPDLNGLHLCELLAADKYRAKNKLQTNASFNHWSALTPCHSSPCQNDGDCIPDFKLNSCHCECKPGFTGTHCKVCKFDFENGISGWTRTGTAFNNQPTYGDNPTARNRESANQQGNWWIGGSEHRPSPEVPAGQTQGDLPQGTLTSPSFNIKGKYISFLIGGGCDINFVRAELIIGSQVVRRITGKCSETMVRETWNVEEFVGQRALVNLIDASSGGWGHINFDDLNGDIDCEQI